jgi:outer membrane protein OmpA-like peptidoglycan-associated protein
MRSIALVILAAALFLPVIYGCSTTHSTVVLVQDPGGRVGKAEVVTEGGSKLLKKQADMTTVSGKSKAPSQVVTADQKFIDSTFGEVLAIEPPQPEKFILYFKSGGTDLVPESQAAITDILAAIKRRGALSISVTGHCDSVGTVQVNDKLSLSRAEAVRDLLIKKGSDPERMEVSSHGKGDPLVPTPDGVAEPRNRRVEVIVR